MDREKFKQLTLLAALDIDEADLPAVQDGLMRTVQMVDRLQQQDTQGVEPLRHPLDIGQRTRSDAVTADRGHAQVLAEAPDSLAGLFLVPRVLE